MQELATSKATPSARLFWRITFAGLLAILVLGIAAPFVNAGRFSGRVRAALESSLGRTVHFSALHFTLFFGPGFSLENVIISEDPRYGLEPFAYVPTLKVRLRLDKLLFGKIRLSGLRLIDPSLNLVKRDDGTWNVVELIHRLSAPLGGPLNLFPALTVADGRIDFKFGTRKTTLYIAEAGLSIYPERSGKIYIQFSGSPARTDRAGNTFSHFRGRADWDLKAANTNRLEADLNLDESNLSELTTLVEGHDIGIHGNVRSVAHIAGPLNALRVNGELTLQDIHRWDLLPSSGEEWRVRYVGLLNLIDHRLELSTTSAAGQTTPVSLQMRISDFLTRPAWSMMANLHEVPVEEILPFAKRMGINLPQDVSIAGRVDGAIGYSNGTGLAGGLEIKDALAKLPDMPPMRTDSVLATVLPDHIRFDPAIIQTSSSGALRVAGEYYFSGEKAIASLSAQAFPVKALKQMADAWFSNPDALGALTAGAITGQLEYSRDQTASTQLMEEKPSWSGQVRLINGILTIPGLASALDQAQGRIAFDNSTFDLTHFTANLAHQMVRASYHYNARGRRTEHLHLQMSAASLMQLGTALQPSLEDRSLLARLRLMHRSIPSWLAMRNLEGDIQVGSLSVNGMELGALSSRFTWEGPSVQLVSMSIRKGDFSAQGQGVIDLHSYLPRWRFKTLVTGLPWKGGLLRANGDWQTSGVGLDMVHNLRAVGSFSAEDVNLTPSDSFESLSGAFTFSFDDQAPNLRLSDIQASQADYDWSGEAATQDNGKLAFDLVSGDRQMHLITPLIPEKRAAIAPDNSLSADR
ncbi:MAG: AsmA family protein [Acidobacteriaceae bacterium]|nr:AsmA family protein [Acidobacteriaceae bacterium]